MEFIVTVETKLDGQTIAKDEVVRFYRDEYEVRAEDIGLTLSEGKGAIQEIQHHIVSDQVLVMSAINKFCRHCGCEQKEKDLRSRIVRTIFGRVDVRCNRYVKCQCLPSRGKFVWPLGWLRKDSATPEYRYLIARWGSLLPYRQAADLLHEFLPLSGDGLSHATVRRHTMAIGEIIDSKSSEPEEYDLYVQEPSFPPRPAARLMVAIDGTYVRANRSGGERQHFVLAGRVERDGLLDGRFAWVAPHATDAIELMKTELNDHGLTAESKVAVLADGADGLKNLVRASVGQDVRSILDWFHISMRLRPIEQMRVNVASSIPDQEASFKFNKLLPNLRHLMWHGKWLEALERMKILYRFCRTGSGESIPAAKRLVQFRKHLLDLREYLQNNWSSLTSYAHARRNGLRISSAPAESNMHHVVNQRMCKRQPMRWTSTGAHFLLQVRCAVLDKRLATLFGQWYPRFQCADERNEEHYMEV